MSQHLISLARQELARRELLSFCQWMTPRFEALPHIKLILEHLAALERREIRRLAISMPPRHGKTFSLEHFCAWWLGRHPSDHIILGGYSSDISERTSRSIRGLVADDRYPFPDTKISPDSRAVNLWSTTAGGRFLAVGIQGAATGSGANLLAIDDPIKNAEEAMSVTAKDSIWQSYLQVFKTRLQPRGVEVIISTRWSVDDPIGRILDSPLGKDFTILRLPALAEEGVEDPLGRLPGEALAPDWFDKASLEATKFSIGTAAWDALYQNNPVPSGGNMCKEIWLKYTDVPPTGSVFFTIDSAFGGLSHRRDYSVIGVFIWTGSALYVEDIYRAKPDYPTLRYKLLEMVATYNPLRIVIEDMGSGKALLADLGESTALPLIPFKPGKVDKTARFSSVLPLIEAGNLYLPAGYTPWKADLISEITRFPNAPHDDQVDVLTMALDTMRESAQPQTTMKLMPMSVFLDQRNNYPNVHSLPGWNYFADGGNGRVTV